MNNFYVIAHTIWALAASLFVVKYWWSWITATNESLQEKDKAHDENFDEFKQMAGCFTVFITIIAVIACACLWIF